MATIGPEVFDLALAQANLNLMNRILKPPKGRDDNISFMIEPWEDTVRRQDERTGRPALSDDTKRAIMMFMCPAELDRHLVLNPGRRETYP